jgi:hypothetical protein
VVKEREATATNNISAVQSGSTKLIQARWVITPIWIPLHPINEFDEYQPLRVTLALVLCQTQNDLWFEFLTWEDCVVVVLHLSKEASNVVA